MKRKTLSESVALCERNPASAIRGPWCRVFGLFVILILEKILSNQSSFWWVDAHVKSVKTSCWNPWTTTFERIVALATTVRNDVNKLVSHFSVMLLQFNWRSGTHGFNPNLKGIQGKWSVYAWLPNYVLEHFILCLRNDVLKQMVST